MTWLGRLLPRTMKAQLFWVTVAGAILTNVLGETASRMIPASWQSHDAFKAQLALHESVANLLLHATSDVQRQAIAAAASAAGVPVETRSGDGGSHKAEDSEAADWVIAMETAGRRLVVPRPVEGFHLVDDRFIYTLIGTASFLFLWLGYAIVAIMVPLSRFARIASAFGRDDGGDLKLPERGTQEIRDVARALNDMRARIRMLVEARTRMLRSISHDLRTPLTRLRLRLDRTSDVDLKAPMLRDVEMIDRMINKTLAYLRDGSDTEPEMPTDLPSLLATICADFSDTGHDVTYRGPARLTHRCRPEALTRAVGNLVENATKYGTQVIVGLRLSAQGVLIEVSDDGPGIRVQDRASVVEPFFRADAARPSNARAGFGLGLAIVQEIVARHDGRLDLTDNVPHGLLARISLPPAA